MKGLVLHEVHAAAGARFAEVRGMEVVADTGDPWREYGWIRDAAGLVDFGFRGRVCLTGADRVRLLNGQVTNDVQRLKAGEGCVAAMVTSKGRLVAEMSIYSLADELFVDVEPGVSGVLVERLQHHVVADDVQIIDVADAYGLLGVIGPAAGRVVSELIGQACPAAEGPRILRGEHPVLGEHYWMSHQRLGVPGWSVLIPVERLHEAWTCLGRIVGGRSGGGAVGWTAMEWTRIERGIPRFGADLDETHLAPEGGDRFVASAISYSKGCYTGQEVIARIRTYGQVTRSLRGMRIGGLPDPELAVGAGLFRDGREVGRVTSAMRRPGTGALVGLGCVRRESNALGTVLEGRGDRGSFVATLVPIPFEPVAGPGDAGGGPGMPGAAAGER